MNKSVKAWLELTKFTLSFVVSLSPVAAYFMYGELQWGPLLGVFAGTLLLALGVAALNQYQEWRTDRLMERTQNRPIPSGRVLPDEAFWGSLFLIALGTLVLLFTTNVLTAAIGLFNGLWYNLLYTPLKRKTAFAVIPGGVCGALPPIMGWTAAGGDPFHPQIVVLAMFFFLWQVPHFWLILLKYGFDYERAKLPSVTSIWSQSQLKAITFIWMLTSGVAALLLPVFNMVDLFPLQMILLGITLVYFTLTIWALYGNRQKVNYFMAFMVINVFLLLIMVILVVQGYL